MSAAWENNRRPLALLPKSQILVPPHAFFKAMDVFLPWLRTLRLLGVISLLPLSAAVVRGAPCSSPFLLLHVLSLSGTACVLAGVFAKMLSCFHRYPAWWSLCINNCAFSQEIIHKFLYFSSLGIPTSSLSKLEKKPPTVNCCRACWLEP